MKNKNWWQIINADCVTTMKEWAAAGVLVDSVVTDPPYHLTSIVKRFGKEGSAPAKSDGPTGVYKRSSAGFMGKEWDGGDVAFQPETWRAAYDLLKPGGYLLAFGGTRTYHRLACAIEDAGFEVRDQICWLYGTGFPKSHNLSGEWQGWGTALKPAIEPIVVARKPPIGTVAENVLAYGTGALNIDGCRIAVDPERDDPRLGGKGAWSTANMAKNVYGDYRGTETTSSPKGRWPANVIHDGSAEVESAFPAGSARFFYSAKASKADRAGSKHPTVKPIALMRYLCRLVTPPGGVVLDPFCGSGTTVQAAMQEGFNAIGIEREAQYHADATARMKTVENKTAEGEKAA